jgi:twitching motility protein PilI
MTSLSNLEYLLPQLFRVDPLPGTPYLQVYITPDSPALLPMDVVQESLLVLPDYVSPLPDMPKSVIGLMSSQNEVFCLVDLPQLLSLTRFQVGSQHYPVIVTRDDKQGLLGLVVNEIQGILRVEPDEISSDPEILSSPLKPYSMSCAHKKGQQIPILDMKCILKKLVEQSVSRLP